MLPLRGLRVAVSKSNSSSRVPSTTTTRVSSGWLASMSMRLAMGSLRGVGSLPARATGGQAASGGRGGRCAIDPSNGQTLAKTGKHRAAGPQLGPADLGFPLATACLTVLPQARRAQFPVGAPTRPGSETAVGALQPHRGKRFERRRLLARRNIRGSLASDNQNIALREYR